MIDAWGSITSGNGRVLRSVDKGGAVGDGLSAVGIFQIVQFMAKPSTNQI